MLRAATDGLCAEICLLCSAVRPWVALWWLVHFKQATTHPNPIRIEEDIVKQVYYAPRSDLWSVCGDMFSMLRNQTLGRTAVVGPFQMSYYTFKSDQN